MRSLKQYIVESVHTYNYTIKIAGDVDKNWLDLFKYNLKKFDPVNISEPKSTPIQKDPYGFPNLSNQSVTIIKAEFRYPANEPMIQQRTVACFVSIAFALTVDTVIKACTNNTNIIYIVS